MGVPILMDIYPLCNNGGYLSTNLAMIAETIGRRGIMISHASKAPRDGGSREECIRGLGAVLNALVSQSRALTAQASETFSAGLQPAAFHIALWLNAFGPAKPSAVAQAVGMDRSAASRLTRELMRLGLIEKSTDPSDRRSIVLCLSVDGCRRMDGAL